VRVVLKDFRGQERNNQNERTPDRVLTASKLSNDINRMCIFEHGDILVPWLTPSRLTTSAWNQEACGVVWKQPSSINARDRMLNRMSNEISCVPGGTWV
jgi:hypothetical protein